MSIKRKLLKKVISGDNKGDFFISYDLYKDIETFLAQPEQTEPVAWMWDEMFCEDWTTVSSVIKPSKSKYVDNVRPLYLTPLKREPLSDEEIEVWYSQHTWAMDKQEYMWGFRDAEKAYGITRVGIVEGTRIETGNHFGDWQP